MTPWLRWSLFGTLGLSAWALRFPTEAPRPPEHVDPQLPFGLAARSMASPPLPNPRQATNAALAPSHADLPQPHLDAAIADPFVGVKPPPPPPLPPVVLAAPPVLPPAPPALNYRFLGRVVDPDGKLQVYLSGADKEQLVSKGAQLAEGYVIQAITPTAVELYYPPLDYRTQIRIPPDGAP